MRCRWATSDEAGGARFNPVAYPSLSLDGDNCIVKYDGTMDTSQVGVKPIALMMEDFDSEGNIRSSVPVQFLAQVWTPTMNRNGFIIRKIEITQQNFTVYSMLKIQSPANNLL